MADRPSSSVRRPASILELAQLAQNDLYDPSKPLKSYLRLAEKHRAEARDALQRDDLESAFVQFAKAATLVLEKLPTHREFKTLLNESQRTNLDLNGRDILDNLSDIKPVLLDRYERWAAKHPTEASMPRQHPIQLNISNPNQAQHRSEDEAQRAYREDQERRSRETRSRAEPRRKDPEEYTRRQDQALRDKWEEDARKWEKQRQDALHRDEERARARTIMQEEAEKQRKENRRNLEESGRPMPMPDAHFDSEILTASLPYQAMPPPPTSYPDHSSSTSAQSVVTSYPVLPPMPAPRPVGSRPPSFLELTMPLEGPRNPEDSETDTDTDPLRRLHKLSRQHDQSSLSRASTKSSSYPPPVTTTSPPPNEGPVQYPRLMTHHQQSQGYTPSLHSMFVPPVMDQLPPSSLLFDSSRQPPINYPKPHGYSATQPSPSHLQSYPQLRTPSHSHPNGDISSHRMISDPRVVRVPSATTTPGASQRPPELKTVTLPREALPRFLSIARLNTALNKETCGLLLGRDKGNKYVVTTLLIPKQHSTSDTCTMDEEELVLTFTEGRALITLGWIHTHPSQSCFMSSVDLHTHSGFQCMLPESFAVVCAPKHQPNYGIFRLTDPPGLQTILHCREKEAFHPHPDIPIYTDADKGHVQMKDINLEIVDLR